MHYLETPTPDAGTGFQGEFDAIESDGPGPLRCKYYHLSPTLGHAKKNNAMRFSMGTHKPHLSCYTL